MPDNEFINQKLKLTGCPHVKIGFARLNTPASCEGDGKLVKSKPIEGRETFLLVIPHALAAEIREYVGGIAIMVVRGDKWGTVCRFEQMLSHKKEIGARIVLRHSPEYEAFFTDFVFTKK